MDPPTASFSGLEHALRAGQPAIVRLAGRSMEPSLRLGWKLRVVPLVGAPCVGDVVVLRGAVALITHRVVATFEHAGATYVFHLGDGSAYPALTTAANVLGRVDAVLWPDDRAVPTLESLAPDTQRAFRRWQRACGAYALAWRATRRLGPGPRNALARVGHATLALAARSWTRARGRRRNRAATSSPR